MTYKGTIKGNGIEVEGALAWPEGTRVEVTVRPLERLRKGSPKAILQLVGSLSREEAELIRETAAAVRRVDASLWSDPVQ